MMSHQLLLYTTSHCHLCEIAFDLLNELRLSHHVKLVEIADNAALIQQYGTRIPVLQRVDDLSELSWPFTKTDVVNWMAD